MSAIDARISYEGTEEGAQQLDTLLGKLGQLASVSERTAGATDRLEDALGEEAAAAQRAERELAKAARATGTLTETTQGAAVRVQQAQVPMAAFGSAIGGVASQIGGLNPELDALGQAMGAVSTGMATAASMPGPWGLALGGLTAVVGVATAALRLHSAQVSQSAQAQRDAAAAVRALGGSIQEQAVARVEAAITESNARILRLRTEGDNAAFVQESANLRALQAQREEALRPIRERQALDRQLEQERREAAQREQEDADFRERNARELAEVLATMSEIEQPRARRAANENGETLADIDEELQIEAARERHAIGLRELDTQRQIADLREFMAQFDRDQEAFHRSAFDRRVQEIEELAQIEREKLEGQREAEERANEARLEQAREITGAIEGTLQQVAAAYIDAFGQAIEGQKTLEQAALEATKALLKSIGEEMVALGIKETLEGFANIVANPPVAATKIPMGIALIAAGAGLGAAGAAIPSQPAAPAERPRGDTDRGSGEGGQTLILNYNSPIISTGTTSQLTRQLGRQMRDGAPFPTRSAA